MNEPTFDRSRHDYWLFYSATLLCFFTVSQTALLAVIFKDAGMSEESIGLVLGIRNVSAICGTLYSGILMGLAGILRTAMIGLGVIMLSFIGLQFCYAATVPALIMRLAAGAGFGIFIPAGFLYMRMKSRPEHQAYNTTVFGTAMIIPNVFAPAVAESYINALGIEGFFLVMGIPVLIVIAIIYAYLNDLPLPRPTENNSYWSLLQDRRLALPLSASLVVGILFGFVYSFIALWLNKSSMPVSWFFTPYAAVALFSAFVIMRYARSMSPATVVAAAFSAMALSLLILAFVVVPASVVVSGILFALGYSVSLPTIIVWASHAFAPAEQARPTALVNTVFNVGGALGPVIGGLAISNFGFSEFAFALCFLSAAVGVRAFFARQTAPVSIQAHRT